jgi:translation elongation factor EF-Tu-like GTPase
MNDKKLDALLEQAHAELQKVDTVDVESLKLLQDLQQDVQELLDKAEVETPSVLVRMQKAIERFEVDHPALTTLISELSAILSNAGI